MYMCIHTLRIHIDIHFSVSDKSKEPESKQFVGLVIGILTTVIVMLLAAIMFIFYRNRRLKAALAPSTFYDQQGDLKVIIKLELLHNLILTCLYICILTYYLLLRCQTLSIYRYLQIYSKKTSFIILSCKIYYYLDKKIRKLERFFYNKRSDVMTSHLCF